MLRLEFGNGGEHVRLHGVGELSSVLNRPDVFIRLVSGAHGASKETTLRKSGRFYHLRVSVFERLRGIIQHRRRIGRADAMDGLVIAGRDGKRRVSSSSVFLVYRPKSGSANPPPSPREPVEGHGRHRRSARGNSRPRARPRGSCRDSCARKHDVNHRREGVMGGARSHEKRSQ